MQWKKSSTSLASFFHVRVPASTKPQLDRLFAGGKKHRLLALQPKLPSRGSCSEFGSLKANLHAWWHLWESLVLRWEVRFSRRSQHGLVLTWSGDFEVKYFMPSFFFLYPSQTDIFWQAERQSKLSEMMND